MVVEHPARRGLTTALLTACLLTLAACGGGGGGGLVADGGGATTDAGTESTGGETTTALSPSDFETAEYRENYGLGLINASHAYAVQRTGDGVVVAVIDSGIDLNHPDLVNQIDPASTDIIATRDALDDIDGHGTAVAGVIAAEKNDLGTHGVAFDAKVLAIRTDADDGCAGCSYSGDDIAAAIDYARTHGAQVVNISLGGGAPLGGAFERALADAVDAGMIVVAASGNDGAAEPDYPARYAATVLAGGQMLSVGAVDSNADPASFSNQAGATAAYHIMAPGVGVATTGLGGGVTYGTGTSFASPHAAGAAAVLLDHAPTLTAQQVVDLLLTTARDLGRPESEVGQGLIDLAAALSPQGATVVPTGETVDDGGAPVTATALSLGPAFGDSLAGASALGEVLFVDGYRRPYTLDLRSATAAAPTQLDIKGLVAPEERRAARAELGAGTELKLRYIPAPVGGSTLFTDATDDPTRDEEDAPARLDTLSLTSSLGETAKIQLGVGLTAARQVGLAQARREDSAGFITAGSLGSPYLGLLDDARSVAYDQRLGSGFGLRVALAHEDGGPGADSGLVAELVRDWRDGARVSFQFGGLNESRAVLDTVGDGALALSGTTRTRFVGLGAAMPLDDKTLLLGQYTAGWTEAGDPSGSLVSGFSALRSSAFALGASRDAVLDDSDRLGLLLSRPLRIDSGRMSLAVPVTLDSGGGVSLSREDAGLKPSGAELDAELAYALPVGTQGWLSANAMLRLDPGHSNAAPAETVGILRYRISW